MGFFDENPEFGSVRSDREQEVLDAMREREERMDKVMSSSLIGECCLCGAWSVDVLLGICENCS